ncbi:polysaccharide deacetylase family protein [Alicyclobacillus sp. ALC3]|uniref:polysaccharide deacetylase family protein n=1 Tax=Alicyclobacillus sp. ALC3 TaxID=2796143 RepID=UPI0023786C9F|nr:polysaccharide deacetylase family protein [Alicyclobacillus sp. ALC3]WDL95117.1 polysaccharide deacetylase family protein [Alicyclobacillus sp. ALC3]
MSFHGPFRQVPQFQHGPERASARPPHTQHVDWHARYPNEVILRGPSDRRAVALTFDDGPDNVWTPLILSVLAKYSVKATFTCVGQMVQGNPAILQQIFQAGHNIENHSWSHPDFTKVSATEAKSQIERTNLLISQILHVKPRFFRPPYGAINDQVIAEVVSLGMKILYWDVDSLDWSGLTKEQVVANVLAHTEPGSIILMHSAGGRGGLADTVQALPSIIETFRREGYLLTTLADLLREPAYQ